ncbi:MAG: hypothetical protein ACOYN5_04480 [Bacteroidales bacterium]
MRIFKQGSYAAIDTGVGVYLAEISAADRETPFSGVQPYFSGTNYNPILTGEFQVLPHGAQNNLPEELRQILDDNHLTAELLNKQAQLLWGQGPETYQIEFKDGKRNRLWVRDKQVTEWLKSWDWEDYLLKATVEFRAMNSHGTKYFRNRAPRIGGKGLITHLEHVGGRSFRLEWPGGDNLPVKNIIQGDFGQLWRNDLRRYPVFDHRNPFAVPVSMRYSSLYSFAQDHNYARPSTYGIFNWIKLGSSLPRLLMNYNINSAAIRYHIISPAIYWSQKQDQLKANCELSGTKYTDALFEDLKDEIYRKFAEGLIGIEKAGKMITTESIYDELGGEYVSWKVDTIDQKVKNYIDAQIEIAKRAAFEITAGVGLHPALSNMSADGNLPSGSEQLYAFKLYLKTAVDIPESIVCKDINLALAANFPEKDIKIGFYHDVVLTEEATAPADRTKNN